MENYRKKYNIKNIEKYRNYYNDHKDSIAEYEKLYYHQNRMEIRDKQRAYFQKYYLLNKETINNNSLQRYYNINYSHPSYNNDFKKSGLSNFNNELLDRNIIIRFTDESN